MTKELFVKFLKNQCSELELDVVMQWVKTGALEKEGQKIAFDDWKDFQPENDIEDNEKFTALFDKIQEKIDYNSQIHKSGKNKTYTISIFTRWLTRAAAILLIPVSVFLFYTHSEKKSLSTQFALAATDSVEIIAPIGSRTIVQLSDGTEVHLNFGSRIKYPRTFSGHSREVTLVGEGYFNVAHNTEKPFIVKTGKLNVKALGTSFNVQSYVDKAIVAITLVSGMVVLEQTKPDGETKKIGILEPGQHVAYNTKTGATFSSKGNVNKYIAWKEGKLIFEDTPVLEVAEKLSRMFNVDIQVDKEIEDFIYSVTFMDEPLYQILDLMTIATPVRYKLLSRKKLPDGTYTKQTIIIEKKKI